MLCPSKANDLAAAQVAAVVAALPALRAAVGAGGCGARLDVRAEEMHGDLQNHDQRAREIAQQIEAIRNAHRLDS
jgi:hypothetical protein